MNAIQTFQFETSPVRTLLRDNEPWFVGRDVCSALAVRYHKQALGRLDGDERIVCPLETEGGIQDFVAISEPGVYRLVFTSRTQAAERFKRWLAHDVLPSLRRTGRYEMDAPEIAPAILDDEDGAEDGDLPQLSHGRLWDQPIGKINAAARLIGVAARLYGPASARALWEAEPGLPPLTRAGAPGASLDRMSAFLFERTDAAPGASVQASVLYSAYEDWCRGLGASPASPTAFGRYLVSRGISRASRRSGRYYLDLFLLPHGQAKIRSPACAQPIA